MKLSSRFVFGAALGSLLAGINPALAQSSAFTYRGRLAEAGSPASGTYDLRFAIYDAVSGGAQQGATLTNDLAGAFSVEGTTNLLDWLFLGPATPRYEFTDTNAPAIQQRYYRLRWP